MKEIDIISRLGKKTNDIKHFKQFLPLNIEIIIEPFAGGFAVSKYYVKNNICVNVHINDNDEQLFYIYKHYKDYIGMRNFIQDNFIYGYDYKKLKPCILELPYNIHLLNNYCDNFIIRGIIHKNIKSRIYNETEKNILDTALITCDDYINIFEQYKNNEKAFIFLDPPYIFSNNSTYNMMDTDNTEMVPKIYEFMLTCKCKVLLIINDLEIIRYIFKNFVKGKYNKIYLLGKKRSRHLIICNYEPLSVVQQM